jgi:PPOX class probable F420-dependent enzyme
MVEGDRALVMVDGRNGGIGPRHETAVDAGVTRLRELPALGVDISAIRVRPGAFLKTVRRTRGAVAPLRHEGRVMSRKRRVFLGRRLVPVYERLRKREATLDGVPAAVVNSVRYLAGAKYLLLESERANGMRVATPMWFAAVDDTVFLRTEAGSAKVRRISRRRVVRVAACTFRGIPVRDYIVCVAWVVPPEREAQAEAALRRGYGLGRRLFSWFIHSERTYLELMPLVEQEPVPGTEGAGASVTAIGHTGRRQSQGGGAA